MAQAQSPAPAKTPWTKIFTAFKIALDFKKLLLAAFGIFFLWVGWWILSVAFYSMRSKPEWKDFEPKDAADLKTQWDYFKLKRQSWNLLHELAGSPSERIAVDAGDVADGPEEFKVLNEWTDGFRRGEKLVIVKDRSALRLPDMNADIKITLTDANAKLPEKFPVKAITIVDPEKKEISVYGVTAKVDDRFKELKEYRDGVYTEARIDEKARELRVTDPVLAEKAYDAFHRYLVDPKIKPSGTLRIDPWHEDRGGNPYLLVGELVKTGARPGTALGETVGWLYSDEIPVLLEPLFKFLAPVAYMFDARAGFWDRFYLILVILWTLAVWGFFGGAICRIAAVQFARNERIPLKEAILFTKERCASYFAAPVFPLVLIAILVVLLLIFGLIEWIPWVGDVFAGVFWVVVLLLGFVIAIVLVGLVGWPLMIATISTEGSDSFDALSRSYSYVYQAPWRYLWYSFLVVLYGAAVVFFVGFMASLMVFMGKWGVSSAFWLSSANPKNDREPSYLFYYAPTSMGWRDLLISSNTRYIEETKERLYDGRVVPRLEFKPEYHENITGMNKVGAVLVACWIYPLFLLMVGFAYSFFWTSSTIIYHLMRHSVDETELEEVYLDEEELEDPFAKQPPPSVPLTPPAAAGKPGTLSLNVVEAPPPPPSPPPAATSYTAEVQPPPPITSEQVSPPPPFPPPSGGTS